MSPNGRVLLIALIGMKTAIIGLGAIGATVAKLLTQGDIDVIVSQRNLDKAEALARELGDRAKAMPIDAAVEAANIIILAISFDAIKDFVPAHRSALAGKVVVDPSNPIAADGKGGFKKIIPEGTSSGEILAPLLPGDAEFVKAFGTLTSTSLAAAANRSPKAVLFYATDSAEAGAAVSKLIEASGYAPVRVGGLDQSIRLEVFGELHEYGKLGKLVSVEEAKALLSAEGERSHSS